jgi:AraC-like DNA-binding protein
MELPTVITAALEALRPRGLCAGIGCLGVPFAIEDDSHSGISFHLVLSGTVLAGDGRGPLRRLTAGQAILGVASPLVLMDRPGRRLQRLASMLPDPVPWSVNVGGNGAVCAVYCGGLELAPGAAQLWLTEWGGLRVVGPGGDLDDPAITALQALIAAEAQRPRVGPDAVLERLTEAWFALLLRTDLARNQGPAWLTAAADPAVALALAAIRADPGAPWTVARLAQVAGLGRTRFHERFQAMVHESPLAHVARWRIQRGLTHLRAGASVESAAAHAGYADAPAFSRAVRRLTGRVPTAWRQAG